MIEMENQDMQLIENYLQGDIDDSMRQQVENRLEQDSDFRALLNETRNLLDGIEFSARNDTLQKLKTLEDQLPPFQRVAKSIPLYRKPWALGVAASLTIILLSTYFLFFLRQVSPYESVFEKHFEVYPNVISPTVRGAEKTEKTTKQKAYYLYDAGNFEESLKLFAELPENEDEGAVLLYSGISYMMLEQDENAIVILEKYKSSSYKAFLPQINWYLGLSYLRNNQPEKAVSDWDEIPTNSSYRKKVDDLKSSLEN